MITTIKRATVYLALFGGSAAISIALLWGAVALLSGIIAPPESQALEVEL